MADERPTRDGAPSRRAFLGWVAMGTGLAASAVVGVAMLTRFLLPGSSKAEPRKLYVGQISDIPPGSSRTFRAPSGERFLLTNTGKELVAFNDTCPHLGCKVHWVAGDHHFFCPCHGGVFDAAGLPTAGPPKDEDTPLRQLELVVEGPAVYALVQAT